ncbi:TRAP transporter small permease subunit [Granulosicoccus antarcticus]|uniref:TRAP transporter small permease protein n=1 Tax=Granulosicoccus antarcticus IMCC3135 TaxID=1192854 RepID=A0A2Z2NHH2_9GAMM|nr:TRAP transporter small permease [Granulosicoccus antarcticus]ASJ70756.1 hypothetical protein IMCC3135_03215 [Granulosicoccus antarcticus IMCC3135]
MNPILNLIDRLSHFAESAAVVLIYGYCGLMLAEVFARSQAQSSSFSWEYSQYAMAAILALASGPAIRTGVHVRIGVISEHLSIRLARWLDVWANLIALCIVSLIVWAMFEKTGRSFDRNILATTVTKTPLWIPQLLVLWGFVQLWLDCAARLYRRYADLPFEWKELDTEVNDD